MSNIGASVNDEFIYDKNEEAAVKKGFFKKVKKFTGKIPFTKDALSMYYCAIDSKTPLYVKGIVFGALAYFISPVDAIPDVLIGMGMVDDGAVIMAALKAVGSNVKDEHMEKAETFFNSDSNA
jgi:uncharacterized membrane protein YkvA (DUF1232 family)